MQPFPRWISWIFVALLAYIIYVGNQAQHPPEGAPQETSGTQAPEPKKEYDAIRRLVDGERWYRAINPNYVGNANIREVSEGEGPSLACGGEVDVLLRGTDANGANFDTTHDETTSLRFIVGEAPIEALNEGLIGMRKDGVRQLHSPAKFVYKEPEKRSLSEITFHITLKDHVVPQEEEMAAFAVTTHEGNEELEPARCGQPLKAELTIFDARGKRLASTQEPITFTLGTRALAQGVDALARGIESGETRLLTIPPAYLKQSPSAGDIPAALRHALRGEQTRFVRITRVP